MGVRGTVSKTGAVESDDLRTFPVEYRAGNGSCRGRAFAAAVELVTESPFADWPLEGPRTTSWLLQQLVAMDSTPLRRHYWWRGMLGLNSTDEGVGEHEFLCQLLESSVCYDQINAGELVVCEFISRRLQLWEESYGEKLGAVTVGAQKGWGVDDEETALFLGKKVSPTAALVCPQLTAWISGKVAERTAVRKERRKGREERALVADDKGSGSSAKPDGKAKGKAKAAGKPDK